MRLVRVAGIATWFFWCFAGTAVPDASGGAGNVKDDGAVETAASDSLDLLEEVLSRGVAEDAAPEIASELNAEYASRERPGAWRNRLFFNAEVVAGYRSLARAAGGWRSRAQSGRFDVRRDRDRIGGFVEVTGVGPLAQFVAGGIRPRFGEGLLVGVRRSPFTLPRSFSPGAGAAVAPTSSIWGRKLGAALSFRAGVHAASAAAWRGSDGSEACWMWLSRGTPAGTAGLALGTRRAPGVRQVDGIDVTLSGVRAFSTVVAAGELARFRGRVFAAVRFATRTEGVWSLEMFDSPAPRSSSGGTAGPGDEFRRRRGGALHRTEKFRGIDTRFSVYANALWTSSSYLQRQRFEAAARSRTGNRGWWSASIRLSREAGCEHTQDSIDYRSRWSRSRQVYVRAGWTGSGGGRLRQRYRLAARFDDDGSTGVVGTLGLTLVIRYLEASFQVSNYSMASGHTGYIVRPGVIGPESISSVTRTGSDASARVRVRWRGARLAFYWAQPWQKPTRSYLSLQLSL